MYICVPVKLRNLILKILRLQHFRCPSELRHCVNELMSSVITHIGLNPESSLPKVICSRTRVCCLELSDLIT